MVLPPISFLSLFAPGRFSNRHVAAQTQNLALPYFSRAITPVGTAVLHKISRRIVFPAFNQALSNQIEPISNYKEVVLTQNTKTRYDKLLLEICVSPLVIMDMEKRDAIVAGLTRAYWMEIETTLNYLAISVDLDGVRAEEIPVVCHIGIAQLPVVPLDRSLIEDGPDRPREIVWWLRPFVER